MVFTDGNGRAPLRLEPFRAIMYANPASLPRVTSPPYDVVGPDGVAALEAADPYNVVRLILPRSGAHDDRYHHAERDLAAWSRSGVLTTDAEPALWVYRHSTPTGSALGLVGAIGLDGPVLPHESTFPGPVADRVALMRTTGAQLEPILLTYRGDGPASDEVDIAAATPPEVSVVMPDGSTHELWRLADPAVLTRIAADLAGRSALIADGHHRFAAYRRVHAERGARSTGTGLAVLVDAARHRLELHGVHRVVRELGLDEAVTAALRAGFVVDGVEDAQSHSGRPSADGHDVEASQHSSHDPATQPRHMSTHGRPPAAEFDLTDGTRVVRVRATEAVLAALPADRSERWRGLDAAVLKHGLLGAAWGLDDVDRRVFYVHDDAAARTMARELSGVAAMIASPDLDDVMALAAAGETMPQKSTSFGPKPRTGLLMRWTP